MMRKVCSICGAALSWLYLMYLSALALEPGSRLKMLGIACLCAGACVGVLELKRKKMAPLTSAGQSALGCCSDLYCGSSLLLAAGPAPPLHLIPGAPCPSLRWSRSNRGFLSGTVS